MQGCRSGQHPGQDSRVLPPEKSKSSQSGMECSFSTLQCWGAGGGAGRRGENLFQKVLQQRVPSTVKSPPFHRQVPLLDRHGTEGAHQGAASRSQTTTPLPYDRHPSSCHGVGYRETSRRNARKCGRSEQGQEFLHNVCRGRVSPGWNSCWTFALWKVLHRSDRKEVAAVGGSSVPPLPPTLYGTCVIPSPLHQSLHQTAKGWGETE